MNMLSFAINAAERAPLPDSVTLAGIDFLVGRTRRRLSEVPPESERAFAETMRDYPVATHTDAANAQHYELPPEFFALALGPQRKYSSCLYPSSTTTLAEAETLALAETVLHADIRDGQTILELGCGWGSLSLYLASRFPKARITSVSNSASQRAYIEDQARRRGIANLTVITADMNVFSTAEVYDRIVSVEMFEHMSNWRALLERSRGWLAADGRMFLHVFTHQNRSYRFDASDPADWIAHHFFTGGIMPSFDLPHRFGDLFTVEQEWRWSGLHYRRTALDWLANFDRESDKVDTILRSVYGADAALWRRRWRLFFLATAGLGRRPLPPGARADHSLTMASGAKPKLDPLTEASVTVAWVILANKPFYPLYVWWLVGSGVAMSCWTMIAAPLFLCIALLGRRFPLAARVGVPMVGTLDTLFETKLFGTGSGTELFLAPCIMLTALSFYAMEKWWQRGLAAAIFCIFAVAHNRLGAPLISWNATDLASMLNLNAF
eukprot:gene37451-50541_t